MTGNQEKGAEAMSEKRRYGILWSKSMLRFAQCVWGLATYLGVLAGAVVLAIRIAGGNAAVAALVAVGLASLFNWSVFAWVEHGELKRLND
jgi:hypothetical protein